MSNELDTYQRQSFGSTLEPKAPVGLLIVDFVNGFADPDVFGGGNIAAAIERTVSLLAHARERGWPIAHSRIVFADDDADLAATAFSFARLVFFTDRSPCGPVGLAWSRLRTRFDVLDPVSTPEFQFPSCRTSILEKCETFAPPSRRLLPKGSTPESSSAAISPTPKRFAASLELDAPPSAKSPPRQKFCPAPQTYTRRPHPYSPASPC